MRPVIIPVETASRELLYKVVLCATLAERGVTCYLGSKRAVHVLLGTESNYVYLDKGYHRGATEAVHERVTSRRGVIVNLDEEGAVDFPDGSTLRNRYPEELFTCAARVFLWGTEQERKIREAGIDADNVVVSGHPRFELLKEHYRVLYASEVERLKQRFGRFILFNTNMGFGNNIRGNEWVRKNYASRFQHLDRIISFDGAKFEAVLDVIHRLRAACDFPIVVRPHPEEPIESYQDRLQALPDVHVLFEGSAVDWILASELMIHPDCTTAIEARMLGKPALSFLPENPPMDLVTALPLKASQVHDDPERLVQAVLDLLSGKVPQTSGPDAFLNEWFAFENPSMSMIAEHIHSICSETDGHHSRLSAGAKWKLLKGRVRRNLFPRSEDRLIANKLKGFSKEGVDATMARLAEGGLLPKRVSCQAVDHDLFAFRRLRA